MGGFMNKHKLIGVLFAILGVLVIVGASYVIISYASGMMTSIVDFVTTNDFTKLQQCGVTPPTEFHKLKNELTTIVLPFLYLGLPALLILLSFLMFLGGFYYHRGRHEDERKRTEEMERHMLRKAVHKIASVKGAPTPSSEELEEMPEEEEEPEEELVEEELEEEEPKVKPPPKKTKKKK
jgi:hypothetical protein